MASIPKHQWNPRSWSAFHLMKVFKGRKKRWEEQRKAKAVILAKMYELYQFKGPRFFRLGEHPDNARALGLNYWVYRTKLKSLMKIHPELIYERVKGRKLKERKRAKPGQWKTPMIPARIRRAEQGKKRQQAPPHAAA